MKKQAAASAIAMAWVLASLPTPVEAQPANIYFGFTDIDPVSETVTEHAHFTTGPRADLIHVQQIDRVVSDGRSNAFADLTGE